MVYGLERKVAIVTGASRGLGKAMAMALCDAGAKVILASPEEDLLTQLAHEIERSHGRGSALAVRTDITNRADCEHVRDVALEHFGSIDILINNARRPQRGPGLPLTGNTLPIWETDPNIWQDAIRVNVNGTFLITHILLPEMMARNWGRIINITTSFDTLQRKHNSPYGVSKAALEAATMIWAQDLAGTGVTCNSLLPGGMVKTDDDPNRASPRGALLSVDVMNDLALFLSSPLSDGITGGRFVGKLWNKDLPMLEAANAARELPVFRQS